jgi:hypothetical protein
MNDQFFQVKLEFDVVLGIVGLPNVCKDCHQFLTFSTRLRARSSLSNECQIPSLNLVVQLLPDTSPLEEHLLYIKQLDEQCRDESLANEAHKQ